MAGTGHSYEIANIDSVLEYLTETCDRLPAGPARNWFLSKIVLKNITAPLFTVRLSPNTSTETLPSMRPEEKPYLLKKIKEGGDVRLFSRQALANSGLNLSHAADWLASLDAEDPVLNKLQRMDPMTVLARADDWTADLNGEGETREGDIETILRTQNGRTWVRLKDENALRHEGARMNHCVGGEGYQKLNDSGTSRIYSLRTSTGKPLATVEYVCAKQTFRQVKRYGNRPIGYVDRRDLCELADLIGNVVPSKPMEHAGLCLDIEGKWRAIEDFAETTTFLDFPALVRAERFESKLFLPSPRNAEATMAVFYSPTPLWWKQEDPTRSQKDRISVNVNVDETQINHIDEQRHLANFVNTTNASGFNIPAPCGLFRPGDADPWPFINREGKLVPLVDTFDVITGNEIDYLRHHHTYFLQAPGNKARTLAIAQPDTSPENLTVRKLRPEFADYKVSLKKDIEPTPSTLRRLVRFLNSLRDDEGLRYVKFKADDTALSNKIRSFPGFGFVHVPDHTVAERIEDGSGTWYRTPWSTALGLKSPYSKDDETEVLKVEFEPHDEAMNERPIRWIHSMLATSGAVDLFCKELNARNAVPTVKFYKNTSFKHWIGSQPVYARGQWHTFQNIDWYLKLLKGRAKSIRLKPLEAEAALDILAWRQHPLNKEQSELLKCALLCWAAKAKIRGQDAETFYANDSLFKSHGRVLALQALYDRGDLTGKEKKAVKRIVEPCMRFQFRKVGLNRYSFDNEKQMRSFFRSFFDILSDKLVLRYSRRFYRDDSFTFFKERYGSKELDPIWIERLKSAEGHPHERCLKNSALSTIGDLGFVIGDPCVKTVEGWLELFRVVIDMKLIDPYPFQRGAENVLKFLSENSETDVEWRNLNDRRGFIEEALKERVRRAEEKQREFMARYRNSNVSPATEAA